MCCLLGREADEDDEVVPVAVKPSVEKGETLPNVCKKNLEMREHRGSDEYECCCLGVDAMEACMWPWCCSGGGVPRSPDDSMSPGRATANRSAERNC